MLGIPASPLLRQDVCNHKYMSVDPRNGSSDSTGSKASIEDRMTNTERRHIQIRAAALRLMAERGYYGASMEDIADLIGIRASSLYKHIDSKQSLLVDIMTTTMEELLANFDRATIAGSNVFKLQCVMEAHVRYHALHQLEARIGNREIPSLVEPSRGIVLGLRNEYRRRWQSLIDSGIHSGEFKARSSKLATYSLLEMGIGVAQWYRIDGTLSLDEIVEDYSEMALRLLGSES
jgi:AcrR family transcriptional regulator